MQRWIWLLTLAALAFPAGSPAQRRVAMVVDTSGSMKENDPQRYAEQITKIVGDLVEDGDRVTVLRMEDPGVQQTFRTQVIFGIPVRIPVGGGSAPPEDCLAGPDPSLALDLNAADRAGFKGRLASFLEYKTPTYFAKALRTAFQRLGNSGPRLLLIVADSGGLGDCAGTLMQELNRFRAGGAMIAAVNLGGDVGAFRGDPPFNFSAAARNSQQLLRPVAEVYQRFLGAKNVQTGILSSTFTVQMDEFVKDAYLVVAADGPLGLLQQGGRNPGAADIDLNYRGGGETSGLDGNRRGYRIVRFKNPNAGPWTFNVNVGGGGGWILIQDRSVGLRLVSRTAPSGMATSLEVEAFDERTGEAIRDPSNLPGMSVEMEIDGRRVKLSDDGASGDRAAGDGIYSASVIFTGPGSKRLKGRLRTGDIDRQVDLTVEVAEPGVSLVPSTPERVFVGQEVAIQAWLQSDAPGGSPRRYPLIQVRTSDGETLELRDDGRGTDAAAGDGRYSAAWIARTEGKIRMSFTLPGESDPPVTSEILVELPPPPPTMAIPPSATIPDAPSPREQAPSSAPESPSTSTSPPPPPPPPPPLTPAAADFSFGTPPSIRIGPVSGEGAVTARLDLSAATVSAPTDIEVSTDFHSRGATFEIETAGGWVELGGSPLRLTLAPGGPRTFPLRVRTEKCPAACSFDESFSVEINATRADGSAVRVAAPLTVQIDADPWLECWWKTIAAVAGMLLGGVIIYGYTSPSRFHARVGVQLSSEEDINEGAFFPIKRAPGSGVGFYRDARVYVRPDYRLAGKRRGAVARLRADRRRVQIRPEAGAILLRQAIDGDWEAVPDQETACLPGVLYCNSDRTLFFELRTG